MLGERALMGGGGGEDYMFATGGTVTEDGDYRIHTFLLADTGTDFTVVNLGQGLVEYLVVGGGGGGGGYYAGGGGAGGYLTNGAYDHPVTETGYTITVGAGGAAGVGYVNGGDGGNSVFDTFTAIGGGGGGNRAGAGSGTPGNSGGSGGGGSDGYSAWTSGVGGAGTTGQGYDGGDGNAAYEGGGGGGSSEVGGDAVSGTPGDGGDGTASSITGSSVTRAGGGGGGDYNATVSSGGTGGGGAGATDLVSAVAGTANTGSGGGGKGDAATTGAAGGSGIVIIKYQYKSATYNPYITATGGNITYDGNYKIHSFLLADDQTDFTVTHVGSFDKVEYLVVAGGGGASTCNGGGGGGGGYLANGAYDKAVTEQAYTITVGDGGAATVVSTPGENGDNSVFDDLTAYGGGGGGGGSTDADGQVGGSGGGGGYLGDGEAGTPGPPIQGYAGGDGTGGGDGSCGGGGGASEIGADATSTVGGHGGAGINNSISGSSVGYAGGGGGAINAAKTGGSATHGGGAGSSGGEGVDGTANTGGGGGGGGLCGSIYGGSGGSGIVIIKYQYRDDTYTPVAYVGNDEYTVLLAHMDGADDGQVFIDSSLGNTVADGIIGTNCGYFDGTGDWLSVPASTDFDPSTAWSVECWVYAPGAWQTDAIIAGIVNNWWFSYSFTSVGITSTKFGISFYNGATWQHVNSTTTPIADTWYHIAATWDGTYLRLFVDGVLENTSADWSAVSWAESAGTLNIGELGGTSYPFLGYMDEFRISSSARYTTTFTPSTTNFTSDANTKLLLHMDGGAGSVTFDDDGNTGHTVTTNGNVIQVTGHGMTTVSGAKTEDTQKKFGNTSAYMDGGDSLDLPSSTDWNFGTGAFTIDFWVHPLISVNERCIIASNYYTVGIDGNWSLVFSGGTGISFRTYDGQGNYENVTLAKTFSFATWYHIALVREGNGTGETKIYVDGTSLGAGTITKSLGQDNTEFAVGSDSRNSDLAGYIDEVRISKGIARWISNFAPPIRIYGSADFISATGGTITEDGDYKVHTFTEDGTFTVTEGIGNEVEYLVVGGGGGGGGAAVGGGGGAGEVKQGTDFTVTEQAYTITVGAGGVGQDNTNATVAEDSVFGMITALKGGAGGSYSGTQTGANGGSGGGGGGTGGDAGGTGVDGTNTGALYLHGHNGGLDSGGNECGGGGGAVGVGLPSVVNTNGGNGGPGIDAADNLAGIDLGGGGGGSGYTGRSGTATHGGGAGGFGGVGPTDPGDGTANTGGGGGGCERNMTQKSGGDGGSGIVIIKYRFQ
jgi:hypothetical protein